MDTYEHDEHMCARSGGQVDWALDKTRYARVMQVRHIARALQTYKHFSFTSSACVSVYVRISSMHNRLVKPEKFTSFVCHYTRVY